MRPLLKIVLHELLIGLIGVIIVGAILAWYASGELIAPVPRYIGHPPANLIVSNATFSNGSDSLVHGWVARGETGQGVVLLLHGLHGDRREMLGRAAFLHGLGYSVLAIDFQGHGESRGPHVTFGFHEADDVVGAIEYLHHTFPGERLGVVAVSLGTSAFLLASKRQPVDAVVLDTPYPHLRQAVESRVRVHVGAVAPVFAPVLALLVRERLGIPRHYLQLEDHLPQIKAPLLMIGGAKNPDVPITEVRALFDAAHEPKELWGVENGTNEDLFDIDRSQYERQLSQFLGKYLKSAG